MTHDPKHLAEQAADYFVRRHEETALQRQQRETWLAADAAHRRAYDEMARVWEHAGNLSQDSELCALRAQQLAAINRPGRFWRGSLLVAAVVALICVSLTVGYVVLRRPDAPAPVSYATQFGERRTETLQDGSTVVLNTDSAIEARYTPGRRGVALQRGEAQFEVTHDATRPFVVSMGEGGTVTALGTRFQVRREADMDVVTLLEGKIEVSRGEQRRILQPNEQARLSTTQGIQVASIDPDQISAWLDGRLRFRNTPLHEVIAEANRYSARKLRLGADVLAGLPLSGSFNAGDSAAIAATAASILPVRVDDSGTDILLMPK